jgi:tryptophanase
LLAGGVPVVLPPGCHAVYVDAGSLLPHIPPHEFPGQALACALYLEAGVRAAEMGSFGFARTNPDGTLAPAAHELMRLALPRRVYTRNHYEYVAEALIRIAAAPEALSLQESFSCQFLFLKCPENSEHQTMSALGELSPPGRPRPVLPPVRPAI